MKCQSEDLVVGPRVSTNTLFLIANEYRNYWIFSEYIHISRKYAHYKKEERRITSQLLAIIVIKDFSQSTEFNH